MLHLPLFLPPNAMATNENGHKWTKWLIKVLTTRGAPDPEFCYPAGSGSAELTGYPAGSGPESGAPLLTTVNYI